MALHVDPYPHDLAGLETWLSETLPVLEANSAQDLLADRELKLIGPFPAFYNDARLFAKEGPAGAVRSGWRALLLAAEGPVALIDISLSRGGLPQYAGRGRSPAQAFEAALTFVGEQLGREDHEVRWLSLADIYVTTLWLTGAENLFVPTRLGNVERIEPKLMSEEELKAITAKLLKEAQSGPLDDATSDDLSNQRSPRSGVPPG